MNRSQPTEDGRKYSMQVHVQVEKDERARFIQVVTHYVTRSSASRVESQSEFSGWLGHNLCNLC